MDAFDVSPLTARERQDRIAEWMKEDPANQGQLASVIVDACGAYERVTQGRYDTCHRDLLALERRRVARREGRPARWYLV